MLSVVMMNIVLPNVVTPTNGMAYLAKPSIDEVFFKTLAKVTVFALFLRTSYKTCSIIPFTALIYGFSQ
jgi:hypothetical protein